MMDIMRHHKTKKLKEKHQKHNISKSVHSSPVLITIDVHSDKELESNECNSSITWPGKTQINKKENESPSEETFLRKPEFEDV